MNDKVEYYGFSLVDNNKLKGVVFSIYQGRLETANKNWVNIINTACWCVHPKYRGIYSFMLLKKQLDENKDCILTSYTPGSDSIKSLNMRVGFKEMISYIYTILPLKIFLIKKESYLSIKRVDVSKIVDSINYLTKFSNLFDLTSFSIDTRDYGVIYFVGVIKSRLIRGIRIKHFLILWTSSEVGMSKYLNQISMYFFMNYLCFYTQLYSSLSFKSNSINVHRNRTRFLYIAPTNISYVPPLGSELSLSSILH